MMDVISIGKNFLNKNINVSIHNPEIYSEESYQEDSMERETSSDECDEETCSEATCSDESDQETCSEPCNDIRNENISVSVSVVYNRPFTEIQNMIDDYNLFFDNVEVVSAHKFFKDNYRDDFFSACFLVITNINILHVYIQSEESKKVYEIRFQVEKNSIQVLSFITNDYALKKRYITIDVNIINERNLLLPDPMIVKKTAYEFLVCRVLLECNNEKNARNFFFNNDTNKEYLWLYAMFNWWNRLDSFYIN
jgi:hypothetical protein